MRACRSIAIAGNIGVGKTTLIKTLEERLQWIPSYETVENNPYLDDFYKDPKAYSFNIQVFFLSERMRRFKELTDRPSNRLVVLDRSYYEDIHIFARSLYESGTMNERDYQNYMALANVVVDFFESRQPIDFIFYMKNSNVDEIMSRINGRGRDCEKEIPRKYIEDLNRYYDDWSKTSSRIITVDITGKDLYEEKNLQEVISTIQTVCARTL